MFRTPLTSLRSYLDLLRSEGELVEIPAKVNADQEIAEIHRRVIAAEGPALLFRNIDGCSFPVVTNLFGSKRRVELAFGSHPHRIIRRVAELVGEKAEPSWKTLWEARGVFREFLHVGTRKVRRGPVLEVGSDSPRLTRMPHLKLWPEDGGHFITLGMVFTRKPSGGPPNLGIYRMQVYDDCTTGMHWQIGKGGGFHYDEAQKAGTSLPVAVFLGGPPALLLSAVLPLPEGVPELLMAGLLQGRRLKMVEPESGFEIPAEAEFALLGEVPPNEVRPEGPFGDHYGYYSLVHDYPVFRCRRVFRRRDPIYPATVVGKPRQEDFYLGNLIQELLAPLFPLMMPSVVDLWSYGETGFHSLAGAVVRERYGREAMMSAFRILGEGQMSLTKFLLVTDQKVDLKDFRSFLTHILARCRWETDLFVFSNLSMDTLDYTGPEVNKGSKGVLLGLGRPVRELRHRWEGPLPDGCRKAAVFCPGCLVLEGPSYRQDSGFPARIAEDESLSNWQLVVVVDDVHRTTASQTDFLWTVFTRFEPAADLHPRSRRIQRSHIVYESPIVVDARFKPWYPKELFPDPEIAAKVEKRWKEYFPDRSVEMGSSDWGHLSPGSRD